LYFLVVISSPFQDEYGCYWWIYIQVTDYYVW